MTDHPTACALQFSADDLLPALVRSLDAMRQPAAKVRRGWGGLHVAVISEHPAASALSSG